MLVLTRAYKETPMTWVAVGAEHTAGHAVATNILGVGGPGPKPSTQSGASTGARA